MKAFLIVYTTLFLILMFHGNAFGQGRHPNGLNSFTCSDSGGTFKVKVRSENSIKAYERASEVCFNASMAALDNRKRGFDEEQELMATENCWNINCK